MSIENVSQLLNLNITTEKSKGGKSSTYKSKIIKSLDKEIGILKSRDNLDLKRITKTSSSQKTKKNPTGSFESNEMRSWRQSNDDPSQCLVMIRLNNKIVGFGEDFDPKNPKYFTCDYDYNVVLKFLENLKTGIESIDVLDVEKWNQFSNVKTKSKSELTEVDS